MKLKEQAHSDLCIRMSEQMRSERATLLSESIRFECAYSAQIIEVGAIPERQLDVPGHGIFSAQQQSASSGAHGFLPPIGRTFNFARVPSQSHQLSHKALKATCGAASISAPHSNALARFAGPNEQRRYSTNPLSIAHWMPQQRSAHSNPLKLHHAWNIAAAIRRGADGLPFSRDIPGEARNHTRYGT